MFDFIDPVVMQHIVQALLVICGFALLGSGVLDGLKQAGVIQDGQTPKWMGGFAAAATAVSAVLNVLPGGADGLAADQPVIVQLATHIVSIVVLALSLRMARFPLSWLKWTVSLTQRVKEQAVG